MRPLADAPPERRDRWIPFAFVGFFLALAGLQAWFVILAYGTFSGLVTDRPYSTGLAYDAVIAAREAETAQGWTAALAFTPTGALTGRVTLTVTGSDHTPLTDMVVRGTVERMTKFPQILPLAFAPTKPGEQTAMFAAPLAGRWFVRVRIEQGAQVLHRIFEVDVQP